MHKNKVCVEAMSIGLVAMFTTLVAGGPLFKSWGTLLLAVLVYEYTDRQWHPWLLLCSPNLLWQGGGLGFKSQLTILVCFPSQPPTCD